MHLTVHVKVSHSSWLFPKSLKQMKCFQHLKLKLQFVINHEELAFPPDLREATSEPPQAKSSSHMSL